MAAVWKGQAIIFCSCGFYLLLSSSFSPPKHNVVWTDAYLCTKWHLVDPCSHFVTIDMGRGLRTQALSVKRGSGVPFSVGQLVPI